MSHFYDSSPRESHSEDVGNGKWEMECGEKDEKDVAEVEGEKIDSSLRPREWLAM